MKRYLKLVNFEVNRFFKLYLVLLGITILSQIIGVIVESQIYLNRANKVIYKDLRPSLSKTMGLCLSIIFLKQLGFWDPL